MDASGRGDNHRQEAVTQTVGLVPTAIFVDLLLSSLQKLVVDVLIAQGAIVVGVISTALELRLAQIDANRGKVNENHRFGVKPFTDQVASRFDERWSPS